jgi:hypothetical protein
VYTLGQSHETSKAQAQDNRAHVVQTASALFRERGYDGVSVAELMAAAGFTHGGFYKQFRSKADLMAESAACGMAQTAALAAGMDRPAFVRSYLSRTATRVQRVAPWLPWGGCGTPAQSSQSRIYRGHRAPAAGPGERGFCAGADRAGRGGRNGRGACPFHRHPGTRGRGSGPVARLPG